MTLPAIQEQSALTGLSPVNTSVATPKVLLTETARWPNVAMLAIGLAKAGMEVSALCTAHHPLRKTRVARQIFTYGGLRPLESLRAAIETVRPQIIVPCDDRAVQHLHELHVCALRSGASGGELAALIEYSLGSPDSYHIVYDRHKLLRIAREEGLRVPDTEAVNHADDFKSWQRQHPFPWVLKIDGTYAGMGVKIAHTFEQAGRFRQELTRYYTFARAIKRMGVNKDEFWLRPWWRSVKPAISVQSYIHGRPANCAVVCWKGRVLAGIGVEVIRTKDPTGPANMVRVVDNPDMMLPAERLARRLGLSGFFGLDFIIEEASGLTYLIEMNPRPTRPSHLQLGNGRDLIGALHAELTGQPVSETQPMTRKEIITYFPDNSDGKSEWGESSFQDAPEGEPELIGELLKPWPPKGLFWHLANQADRMKKILRRYKADHGTTD
jgi:hypothetical protein